jgi:hypothetical protein
MSRKRAEVPRGSKPDQSHKPAKHIEETARLAGSVEPTRTSQGSAKPAWDGCTPLQKRISVAATSVRWKRGLRPMTTSRSTDAG